MFYGINNITLRERKEEKAEFLSTLVGFVKHKKGYILNVQVLPASTATVWHTNNTQEGW